MLQDLGPLAKKLVVGLVLDVEHSANLIGQKQVEAAKRSEGVVKAVF